MRYLCTCLLTRISICKKMTKTRMGTNFNFTFKHKGDIFRPGVCKLFGEKEWKLSFLYTFPGRFTAHRLPGSRSSWGSASLSLLTTEWAFDRCWPTTLRYWCMGHCWTNSVRRVFVSIPPHRLEWTDFRPASVWCQQMELYGWWWGWGRGRRASQQLW